MRNQYPLTVTNLDSVAHDLQFYEREREHIVIMFHRPALTKSGTSDIIRLTGHRRGVTMQCGMHPYMQGHGLAVENPYYVVTGPEGTFAITDLPAGRYRIKAWHPVLGEQTQDLTVEANGIASVGFYLRGAMKRCRLRYRWAVLSAMLLGLTGASVTGADDPAIPMVSRVEVVLASPYKSRITEIREEFVQAGMANVHVQFVKRGQPPKNIGLGREVPAGQARDAIRLALKYNSGVAILLPERLFPPRFVTIASSNYDDTVEYPIDEEAPEQLQNQALTTEGWHRLYHRLTSSPKDPKDHRLRYERGSVSCVMPYEPQC